MRKRLTVLLLLLMVAVLALPVWAKTERLASGWQQETITSSIKAEGMPLAEFLAALSRESGLHFAAVPETAEMQIDLVIAPGQTLEQILNELTQKYSLNYTVNEKNKAVVFYKGAYADRAYNARLRVMTKGSIREASQGIALLPVPLPGVSYNTEEYNRIYDNDFQNAFRTPVSTFSIDVDTASYSNIRRFLNNGRLPERDAVRTEEMLNYFTYQYPQPEGNHPFSLVTEAGPCPWRPEHQLVLVGLQGKNVKPEELPSGNLVFLIDVSGSMAAENKLPLLKAAFKLLVKELRDEDTVSIVTYAGRAGVVLSPTSGSEKNKILEAIDHLEAGGSTAGGQGLKLAYQLAKENFIPAGNNRVILATDGDFNVGVSSQGELTRLIEERREDGIFFSVLGFGMGNIKDNKMEVLADKGNGNYAYIDNLLEAKKVLVGQLAGTLYTIAKDVKLQVEFNPAKVKEYRLMGYENRALNQGDFTNDKKDAGDLGAGQSVTALYEIIPGNSGDNDYNSDPLAYQQSRLVPSEELLRVKVRYKEPNETHSTLVSQHLRFQPESRHLSENFRFAAAVAEYGMLLRNSEFKGQASYQQVLLLARKAKGEDTEGYRAEFIKLVEISQLLDDTK